MSNFLKWCKQYWLYCHKWSAEHDQLFTYQLKHFRVWPCLCYFQCFHSLHHQLSPLLVGWKTAGKKKGFGYSEQNKCFFFFFFLQNLLLTTGSWQLCGLLCLEATKLLISPKLWLCSNNDIKRHYIHNSNNVASNTKVMLLSHHLSSSHWTTHSHSEPELFSLFLWILESHLIKATETCQCNQWNCMYVSLSSIF